MVVFFVWMEGLSVVKNWSVASVMSDPMAVSVAKRVSGKEDASLAWSESAESVWNTWSAAAGPADAKRGLIVGCVPALLGRGVEVPMGVAVRGWCCVVKASLGLCGVLCREEPDEYHHPVTLASGGMELRSWALAARGGRL